MTATIWKQDREIGTAPSVTMIDLQANPKWEGLELIECYYFPRVILAPPVVWEVLSGQPLGRLLDHSDIAVPGKTEPVLDLRYVHGRAEVMKGRPTISTILLVLPHFSKPVDQTRWLSYYPEIYRTFLGLYDPSKKDA